MNGRNNTLNVDDIQTMSISDIVNLFGNGYSLDTKIQGLTVSTWLNESFCIGTAPSQTCIGKKYVIGGVGIVALVLLLRK